MGERLGRYTFVKEDTAGTIATNPKGIVGLKFETDTSNVAQATEKPPKLGDGNAAPKQSYGVKSYPVALTTRLATDNAALLFESLIGEGTETDASNDNWAATDTVAVGDIVNHSNTTQSLTCVKAGTTGGSEPDLTSSNRGDRITDGTAEWIVMPKLKQLVTERGNCLATFTMERRHDTGCATVTNQHDRFLGVFLKSIPLNLTGDTIGQAITVDAEALNFEDQSNPDTFTGSFEAIKDMSGYTEQTTEDDVYGYEDATFFYNGVESNGIEASNVTINNNQTVVNELNRAKRKNTGIFDITGNLIGLFDATRLRQAYTHEAVNVKFLYQKANGCKVEVELQIEGAAVSRGITVGEDTRLDIPFNGFDSSSTKSVKVTIVSPITLE